MKEEMNEEMNKEMNKPNLDEVLEDAEGALGEVTRLLEIEGKDGHPLARKVRGAHERLSGWQERAAGAEDGTGKPGADELDATCTGCKAQRAALERIASGVRPSLSSRGDRGPTMLTIREARAIAQTALHLSEEKPKAMAESGCSPARYAERKAEREAERLRASALSGDLDGAKRQARMILERNEMTVADSPEITLLHVFAQTLLGCLEGKIGVEVRHAVTSSLVRREQEGREAAERRAGQTESESAGLRKTLAWYAKEANYRPAPDTRQPEPPTTAADQDQGRRARQALGESESGRKVARRLEAAEKFIEHLKTVIGNYEQEIAQHDTPG
jgi:hypothetical protein